MPDTKAIKVEHLCFVCSGNICRSPFAEWRARAWLDERGLNEVRTSSCGTLRISGEAAAPFTIRALADRGIDARAHRSRAMSYFLFREADLIIGMEPHHVDAIEHELGGDTDLVAAGTHVITEYHPHETTRNDAGIYDFVQAPWEEYQEGVEELERCLIQMLQELYPHAGS